MATLIGEQPNPPRHVVSRHPISPQRAAPTFKPPNDSVDMDSQGYQPVILGPYLLVRPRDGPPHDEPPDHYDRLVNSARLVSLARHASLRHCTQRIGPPSSSVGGGKMRQRKSATAFAVARLISDQPELTISAPPLLFGRRPPQSNEKLTD